MLIKERYFTAYRVDPLGEEVSLYVPLETVEIPENLLNDTTLNRGCISDLMDITREKYECIGDHIVVLTENYPGEYEGV